MVGLGVDGGNGTRTEFLARVARVDEVRSKSPARMLPETTALVPMEPQTPKSVRCGGVLTGRKIEPYPLPDDFSQFVLLR